MVLSEQQVEADRTSSIRNGTGGGIITGFPLSLSFFRGAPGGRMLSLPLSPHPRLSSLPTGSPAVCDAGGHASMPVVFKASGPVFSGKPEELPSTI